MLGRLARENEFMAYALFVATIACVLLLCAIPRALAPIDLPVLMLDRAAVADAVRSDTRTRAAAPKTAEASALMQGFLELGDLENKTVTTGVTPTQKRKALAQAYDKVLRESGEQAGLALRAEAVEQLERAMRLQLSDADAQRVLGLFPEALARHGVTYEGREVAPHFVMRTLYKARWNLAVGREPDYALSQIELQAYHGWLALHATNLSPEPRSLALQRYAQAGGTRIAEARGVLAFLSNDYKEAVPALEHAYRETGNLRLRNWIRGAKVAASAQRGDP